MSNRFTKNQVATFIAILFHVIGATGILFFNREWFIRSTPFNLLLMLLLLIWTQPGKNIYFWIFFGTCFIAGITAEALGVNTGLLFGEYRYGNALGIQVMKVPLIIGINWFIIIYCCGIAVHTLLMKIIAAGNAEGMPKQNTLKALSIIADGATLAAFFDWLMEPVAVKLNYWSWNGNTVPWFNYFCWFAISVGLLSVFYFCRFGKQNKFAVNLLLVQLMFFLVLRTFMN